MREFTEILSDPAHIFAELVYESAFFALSVLWVKYKLRNRDKDHKHD